MQRSGIKTREIGTDEPVARAPCYARGYAANRKAKPLRYATDWTPDIPPAGDRTM